MRLAAILLCLAAPLSSQADDRDATQIVRDALNHWRGLSSYGEMTMTIHRPDWERTMSMESWSQGEKLSLVRVTAPRKDRGNGTLIDDDKMWTYSPKVNRVIKVPSSMMNQSWMGSDFSNKDIARTDEIVLQVRPSPCSSETVIRTASRSLRSPVRFRTKMPLLSGEGRY